MQPDFPYAWVHLFGAYYGKGMEKEAFDCLKQLYPSPDFQKALDKGFAEAGIRGAARRLAELTETLVGTENITVWVPMENYVLAQDKENALKWLERCYEERAPDMPMIGIRGIQYEFLRSDPRFQDILRKVGLPTDETKGPVRR